MERRRTFTRSGYPRMLRPLTVLDSAKRRIRLVPTNLQGSGSQHHSFARYKRRRTLDDSPDRYARVSETASDQATGTRTLHLSGRRTLTLHAQPGNPASDDSDPRSAK